jgi:methyl coenzyme M reductase subunit C
VHTLAEQGVRLAEIARKMEVTKGCIWKIVHGYRRGQVPAGWVRVRD